MYKIFKMYNYYTENTINLLIIKKLKKLEKNKRIRRYAYKQLLKLTNFFQNLLFFFSNPSTYLNFPK